ncbi:hypothetical protein EX30DRAFT_343484 [Ascodesmis nigricans]|uniref:Uncharacterized protein n=1 Tax=Ascodesmis nigricans TaxID=341454 RepID=A0A4S2MM30_9PEZI|nr:hypothetical protein EX30DRAFT_343484 [Ascodesmis nigricans]
MSEKNLSQPLTSTTDFDLALDRHMRSPGPSPSSLYDQEDTIYPSGWDIDVERARARARETGNRGEPWRVLLWVLIVMAVLFGGYVLIVMAMVAVVGSGWRF